MPREMDAHFRRLVPTAYSAACQLGRLPPTAESVGRSSGRRAGAFLMGVMLVLGCDADERHVVSDQPGAFPVPVGSEALGTERGPVDELEREAPSAEAGIQINASGINLTASVEPSRGESTWRLGEIALLSIDDSAAGEPLFSVSGAATLSDGSIVVADGSRRISVFDPTGRPRASFGGRGQGPGEFSVISWLQVLPGDTVALYDIQEYRLTYFSADGDFIRTLRLGGIPARVRGVFADGTLLTTTGGGVEAVDGSLLVRSQMILHHQTADGDIIESLGTFPGSESVRPPGMITIIFPTFRSTQVVMGMAEAYLATGHAFEVMRISPGEPPSVLVHRDVPTIPLTSADVIASMPGLEPYLRPSDIPLPTDQTFPVTRRLKTDVLGNLWVELFPVPAGPATTWEIYNTLGDHVATIEMPDRFDPHEIGDDYVVGVWRGELDVEVVQVRELLKASSGPVLPGQ